MPQLRTFNAFAPAPQLAQAYASGVKLTQEDQQRELNAMLEREKMANQYNIASMETATRREALAQEALAKKQALDAETAMFAKRMTAQQEQLAQEAMLKNQELEIEKFYKTGMLGISQRGTDIDSSKVKLAADQFLRQREAQDQINRAVADAPDDKKQEVYRNAIMQFGAQADIPGAALSEAMQSGRLGSGIPGKPIAVDVENAPGVKMIDNGQQWVFAPERGGQMVAEAIPGDPSRKKIGKNIVTSTEWKEATQIEKDASKLEDQLQNGDAWAHVRSFMNRDPKTWSKQVQGDILRYNNQLLKVESERKKAAAIKARLSKEAGMEGDAGDGSVKRGKWTLTPVPAK